jgi:gas vesicle protein
MSSGKVLLGVMAGVTAGILLGILFAPDKGWNTRKRIVKKGEEYADSVMEKLDEFLNNISEKIYDVKEEAIDISEQDKAGTAEA